MRVLILSMVLLVGTTVNAWAIDHEPYTEARLAELQAEDALVLVDVFAPWCPVCAKQQKILGAYAEANPDVNLRVLRVDFDNQKDAVRALRAPRQSTILLFKGDSQYWYSVAETREDVIFREINKAAGKE
jgi:thiol-disulfide isomerase/thioredoxin